MKHKDLEVRIQGEDGESFEEYHIKEGKEGDNDYSCYIASEEGKVFHIYCVNESKSTIRFAIYADGVCVRSTLVHSRQKHLLEGVRSGLNCMRPLVFSKLLVTEEDAALNNTGSISELGTLRIDCCAVRVDGPSIYKPPPELDSSAIHERAKKAGSHRIQLGKESPASSITYANVTVLDHIPSVTFTWRYRAKDMLQAQGIIPQDPPPPPIQHNTRKRANPSSTEPQDGPPKRARGGDDGGENDEEGDVPVKPEGEEDEWDELLAQRSALEARIKEIESRRIKREPSPIRLGGSSGGFIDLTGDD